MRYLLLIYDEEAAWNNLPAEEQNRFMSEYGAFSKAIKESKAMEGANRLRPVASATTVRVRQGRTLTTDGPFAETKEQLGGFYLIDVPNIDEALAWAARIPSAKFGCGEATPAAPTAGIEMRSSMTGKPNRKVMFPLPPLGTLRLGWSNGARSNRKDSPHTESS